MATPIVRSRSNCFERYYEDPVTDTAGNPQQEKDKKPKEGISNHPLDEEQRRQAKVLPFRERTDKKETDRKTK